MLINSHSKLINVHTIVLDDNEIERVLDNVDDFLETLSGLLSQKKEPPADGQKSKRKRRTASETVICEWCDHAFRARGLAIHQRTCPQRPA